MAVTKCPNCGANIVEGGKFCAFCGSVLPDDTQHITVEGTLEHNVNIRRERINRAKVVREEQKAEIEKERIRHQAELKQAQAELERERRETQKHNNRIGLAILGFTMLFALVFILLMRK